LNRARERLVRLTKKLGVSLRQSYARVGKLALIKHQRYAHAHQFKRATRSLRKLRTYLGRVIRDIERRIVGNEELREAFVRPLFLARRVQEQERRQRGRKVYSLHAPEVECIGKGKAHRPYEFGVKVSIATTVKHSAGGQFVTHAAALPGNPYDGHTLATVIPQMQALIGNILDRCITDAGYRGHNALLLADLVPTMADSATIDGGEAIGRVLRHVRCNIEVAHVGDEVSRIEALVGTHGDALGARRIAHDHVFRGFALAHTRHLTQFRLDAEAVAVLRHDVARISELCLLTLALLGEFGLGVRGRAVRLIAALLAVKMALAVAPRRWRVTRTVLRHKALHRCPSLNLRA